MKTIKEILKKTKEDKESIKELSIISNKYPTEKGYVIQYWMSPQFVHIVVYKIDEIINEVCK